MDGRQPRLAELGATRSTGKVGLGPDTPCATGPDQRVRSPDLSGTTCSRSGDAETRHTRLPRPWRSPTTTLVPQFSYSGNPCSRLRCFPPDRPGFPHFRSRCTTPSYAPADGAPSPGCDPGAWRLHPHRPRSRCERCLAVMAELTPKGPCPPAPTANLACRRESSQPAGKSAA